MTRSDSNKAAISDQVSADQAYAYQGPQPNGQPPWIEIVFAVSTSDLLKLHKRPQLFQNNRTCKQLIQVSRLEH
ncbi:hypothetical protein IAQ61_004372 [Plenodomus lingam]|uniref:uncharacterized protein n=1 Tax=Leptosphaeria maculans TaxID=5022 RepID=UPI00332CAA86|nr:hypothetical protein IAQ61_004372 [Plenodomus lingam]